MWGRVIYFLKVGKVDNRFFGHGTLFYHKNRLVKRHGVGLGEFLGEYRKREIREEGNKEYKKSIMLKHGRHYMVREVFGHLELPDAVPVNLTKTVIY